MVILITKSAYLYNLKRGGLCFKWFSSELGQVVQVDSASMIEGCRRPSKLR